MKSVKLLLMSVLGGRYTEEELRQYVDLAQSFGNMTVEELSIFIEQRKTANKIGKE